MGFHEKHLPDKDPPSCRKDKLLLELKKLIYIKNLLISKIFHLRRLKEFKGVDTSTRFPMDLEYFDIDSR